MVSISVAPIVILDGAILVIALYLLLNGYGIPKQRVQKIMGWVCVGWAIAALLLSPGLFITF